MRIGTVEISSKLALAPMAGVTDAAFRQICSELGAGYTITELISSKALCYHDKKTFSLLTQFPGEHPAAVQIFGSDPVCMAEAAQIAMEHTGADILDINMGCPMGKIVNNGDGAALMKDPELAGRIVEAVVKALTERPMDIYAGLERLLPKGFTALAASVEDGTCYLNLPGSVVSLLPEDSQKQRMMLEGLVNSLCSLEGVEQVQILLNGDYQMLLGTQPVSRPLLPTE